jgi:carboxylesterase
LSLFPQNPKAAFHLEGQQGKALLLHGFTGTPYEVRPLAEVFHRQGYAVWAPLLPGHGGDGAAINQTTLEQWNHAIMDTYEEMSGEGPTVVSGVSMGGLLATLLASKHPVDALVLIAPAFELFTSGKTAIRLSLMGAHHLLPTIRKAEQGGDIVDKSAQRLNPNTPEIPIRGLQELEKIRKLALGALPQITMPVFLAHGEKDRTIPPQTSVDVSLKLIHAPETVLHRYPQSGHVLPIDLEQQELQKALSVFLKNLPEIS